MRGPNALVARLDSAGCGSGEGAGGRALAAAAHRQPEGNSESGPDAHQLSVAPRATELLEFRRELTGRLLARTRARSIAAGLSGRAQSHGRKGPKMRHHEPASWTACGHGAADVEPLDALPGQRPYDAPVVVAEPFANRVDEPRPLQRDEIAEENCQDEQAPASRQWLLPALTAAPTSTNAPTVPATTAYAHR